MLEATIEPSTATTTATTTPSVIAIATTTRSAGSTTTSSLASLAISSIPATLALGLTLWSEEPVDPLHARPEVLELVVEEAESGGDNFVLLCLAGCNFSDLFLHETPDIWFTEFPVKFLEAAQEGEPQSPGHHVPAGRPLLLLLVRTFLGRPLVHLDNLAPAPVFPHGAAHVHIVSVTDVLDVLRDAGVGADAVLVHQSDQFRLLEVVWRPGVLGLGVDPLDGHLGALGKLAGGRVHL